MKPRVVTTEARLQMLLTDIEVSGDRSIGLDTEAVGPARRYSKANPKPFLNMGYAAIQGISLAFENEHCYYLPLRHRGPNADWAWAEEVLGLLRDKKVWAHNVKFDVGLLEKEGFCVEGIHWYDSMLAAWLAFCKTSGIGLKVLAQELLQRESPEWRGSLVDKTAAEVLEYVCHDALNTLQIGELLWGKHLTEKQQRALVNLETPMAIELSRMERDGMRLDIDKLEKTMGSKAEAAQKTAQDQWDKLFPERLWSSIKDLQELFEEGSLAEQGTTKTGAYKTDVGVMEWNIAHGTPAQAEIAELILTLREVSKVKGTYVDGLREELRQWSDRRLRPELNQMGTRTGRFSSANPNIQNQLSHGEYAPLLKQCYVADPGWLFVSADYAQIELRLFAELAGGTLLQAYLDGADLHQRTADSIGGTRDQGKTFNFGFLIYGGGPNKAAREFGWDLQTAKEALEGAAREYPEAGAFRNKVISIVEQREPVPFVQTKTGRRRLVPELQPLAWQRSDPEAYRKKAKHLSGKYGIDPNNTRRVNGAIRNSGERIAVNTIVQGSAADLAKVAMVDFAWHTDRRVAKLVTMVHDEILCTAHQDHAETISMKLKECMEGAGPKLGYKVPIIAEPAIGKNWGEVH